MRRVWFTFKIFEVILGLFCLGYHARGFLNIGNIQDHYIYVAIFAGFTLMAMFGCLSICSKEDVSPFREGCLNMFAAISFISISLDSMFHAEKDFYLTYLSAQVHAETLEEFEITKPPHSFFKYSKAQSIAALCGGSLFLLHAILAFDFAMVNIEGMSSSDSDEDENDENAEDAEYAEHLLFYVFSKGVHQWLNHFEWFHTLADAPTILRREQLINRINLTDFLSSNDCTAETQKA